MKLKILPFLLPGIVIIYYLCRHFELYFTYLILISITIFVQCYFLTKPLISSLNKIFFAKINLKFRMDYKGLLVAALFVICFFYLLFSYFNTRVNSYDGMYHNLKFILAISDKGYVNSTEYPLKPYLGEVILSFIYSNFGLRFLNLALGILFIATCFIGYRFITYFATDTKLRIISFIVFIFAPTSIAFAFIELKSDLIASLLVVYSFILLKNLIDKKERFEHYLISIFLSIAVLIKTTTIPISILILIFAVYFVFKNSIGIKTFILKIFLMTFLYFIPIFIWFIHFGGTIPQFENKLNISSYHSSGKFFLKRDTDILEICNEEKVVKDYSSFIYGSRSILVFFQPIFYLFNFQDLFNSKQPMATPGILIYIGILSIFFEPFKKNFKYKVTYYKVIVIISFIYTLVFLVLVSSIFWYLYPLFLVYSYISICNFYEYIYKPFHNFLSKRYYKIALSVIFISIMMSQFLFSFVKDSRYYSFDFTDNLFSLEDKRSHRYLHLMNDSVINTFTGNSYILDASEHPYLVPVTFVKNWDLRVIKSNYYFVSSRYSVEEIFHELKSKNINFVILNPKQLKSRWYEGCKENNKILEDFLYKYTIRVDSNFYINDVVLYKIK